MSPQTRPRPPARSAAPTARKPAPAARAGAPAPGKRRFPIALIAGGVLAAGLAAVIVISTTTSGGDSALEVGTPTVTGDALARFEDPANDPALGLPIPEVTGADYAGTPASITRDGRAKMIVFVAHWCSVCQQEVPLIMNWLPGATIPEGIDLYSVSTGVNRNATNYPPSAWLTREGWTLPLIADDAASSVGQAFGLSAYPYFVFVDAEGNVAGRITGGVPAEALDALLAQLAGA